VLRRSKREVTDLSEEEGDQTEDVLNIKKRQANYQQPYQPNYQQPYQPNYNFQQQTGNQQQSCVQCQNNGGRGIVKRQVNYNDFNHQANTYFPQQPNINQQQSSCVQCQNNGGRIGLRARRDANFNYGQQQWNQPQQQQSNCVSCAQKQANAAASEDERFSRIMNPNQYNGFNQPPFNSFTQPPYKS
jgi:hypothetical protein